MASITKLFVESLKGRPHSPLVTNPYRLPHRADNLRTYLDTMLQRPGRRVLVIGEALGYRGGLGTGIPVSSCGLFKQAPHPYLRELAGRIEICGDTNEATASIVWNHLKSRRTLPLFWNAFPFHPHLEDKPDSNRAPCNAEIEEGQAYLHQLAQIYRPQLIAGLGRRGTLSAEKAFPGKEIVTLRHPSYGGKADFIQGMDRLYRSRQASDRKTPG